MTVSTRDSFGVSAKFFDALNAHRNYELEYQGIVARAWTAKRCARVIDWGAATGSLLNKFIEHGWDGFGIDYSVPLAVEANRKGIDVRPGDMAEVAYHWPKAQLHVCVGGSFSYAAGQSLYKQIFHSWEQASDDRSRFYFDFVDIAADLPMLEPQTLQLGPQQLTINRKASFCDADLVIDCSFELRASDRLQELYRWQECHRLRRLSPQAVAKTALECGLEMPQFEPSVCSAEIPLTAAITKVA